jgi:hypothetical protein
VKDFGRPTDYFVEYVLDWPEEGEPDFCVINVTTLKAAHVAAKRQRQRDPNSAPIIYIRKDIRDGTPPEEPMRGLIWDYEDELVTDEYAYAPKASS